MANLNENLELIVREGFLEKQSRFWKNWRTRWIVLTPQALMSFKERKNYKSPTQIIPLAQIAVIKSCDDQTHREGSFKLQTNETKFYFSCESNSEKEQWMGEIGRMVLKNHMKKQ